MRTLTMMIVACLGLFACGEVDQAIDCAQICDEVQECTFYDVDESECRDRCDENTDRATDRCEDCITMRDACTECAVECAGIATAPVD